MPRKLVLTENIVARLPEGTKAQIVAHKAPGEEIAAFIRAAIEREIKHRKRRPTPH